MFKNSSISQKITNNFYFQWLKQELNNHRHFENLKWLLSAKSAFAGGTFSESSENLGQRNAERSNFEDFRRFLGTRRIAGLSRYQAENQRSLPLQSVRRGLRPGGDKGASRDTPSDTGVLAVTIASAAGRRRPARQSERAPAAPVQRKQATRPKTQGPAIDGSAGALFFNGRSFWMRAEAAPTAARSRARWRRRRGRGRARIVQAAAARARTTLGRCRTGRGSRLESL